MKAKKIDEVKKLIFGDTQKGRFDVFVDGNPKTLHHSRPSINKYNYFIVVSSVRVAEALQNLSKKTNESTKD